MSVVVPGVVVIGLGKSGTNITRDLIGLHPDMHVIESGRSNKSLFANSNNRLKRGGVTMCNLEMIRDVDNIIKIIKNDRESKLVFTIRDPRDMIISKFAWGDRNSPVRHSGNDAADRDPEVCLRDIREGDERLDLLKRRLPGQIYVSKLEKLLGAPEETLTEIFSFLGLDDDFDISNSDVGYSIYEGIPNRSCLYKKLDIVYGGFLKDNKDLEWMFEEVDYLVDKYGYRTYRQRQLWD